MLTTFQVSWFSSLFPPFSAAQEASSCSWPRRTPLATLDGLLHDPRYTSHELDDMARLLLRCDLFFEFLVHRYLHFARYLGLQLYLPRSR
jgi:hypothetical protein